MGAILTFAVEASVAGIDLDVVGLILMAVSALGIVMTLLVWGPRRRIARVERPVARQRQVVEERRVYDDPTLYPLPASFIGLEMAAAAFPAGHTPSISPPDNFAQR